MSSTYPPSAGGVPSHVAALASELSSLGHHVEVLTHLPDRSNDAALAHIDGVDVRQFKTIFSGINAQSPTLWGWIARHSGRYDVLHVHSYHALISCPSILLSHAPVVFTPHYHGVGQSKSRTLAHSIYRQVGASLFRHSKRIICVSKPEADLVTDHFVQIADKVTVIPNGIDLAAIKRAPVSNRQRPFLLTVGRLEHYKRVDVIVQALALLDSIQELVIVGSGPEESSLRDLARRLGVASRVHFLANLPAPVLYGLMKATSATVTMSEQEAFGMVLAEAGAAGSKLVASDLAAHRYVASLAPELAIQFVAPDGGPVEVANAIVTTTTQATGQRAAALPTWRQVAAQTDAQYRLATACAGSDERDRGGKAASSAGH